MKSCINMVFETKDGLKVILKTELSSSSLAPLDPTTANLMSVVFNGTQLLGPPFQCVCQRFTNCL